MTHAKMAKSNDDKLLKSSIFTLKAEVNDKNQEPLKSQIEQTDDYGAYSRNKSLKKVQKLTSKYIKSKSKIIDKLVEKAKKSSDDGENEEKLGLVRKKLEEKAQIYDHFLKNKIALDDGEDEEYFKKFKRIGKLDLDSDKNVETRFVDLKTGASIAEREYQDKMKKKWDEIRANNKVVERYQDTLFDEVREHGVGYYNFSTDEEVRKKQMQQLQGLRDKTIKERQEKNMKKKKERVTIDQYLEKVMKRRKDKFKENSSSSLSEVDL